MNWIIALLALELAWCVWRDLDARSYRKDVEYIKKNAVSNYDIWRDNYRSAKEEALFYKRQYEALEVEAKKAEHAGKERHDG